MATQIWNDNGMDQTYPGDILSRAHNASICEAIEDGGNLVISRQGRHFDSGQTTVEGAEQVAEVMYEIEGWTLRNLQAPTRLTERLECLTGVR
tara:strand:- start:85 stop:363 length:279 start_codon:yes stop_codon:yes gene_type:complete